MFTPPKSSTETVAVCFALKEEAAPFRKISAGQPGISILITGIGRRNAEKSAREFLAANSPRLVLTCGFAGGLNPKLKTGAVLFATDDDALHERLAVTGAAPAKFFCSNRIATTAAEKRKLHDESGADAVDMESGAIHAICHERGISCATVRVISDPAGEDLPLDFNALARPDLSVDYGRLAWTIAKSPRKIGALLRLRKDCKSGAERLADVLAKVIFP